MISSRKRLIISTSCLALLFIMIIGLTYAYYVADVRGNLSENPSLRLKSGYLSIIYEGKDATITGGSTSDTTDDLIYTKNFSVTNSGVADSYFGVWIKDYQVLDSNGTKTTLERPEDWTYVLKSGDTIIKTGTFPTEDTALITAYPLSINTTKELTLTVTYNYITLEEGGTNQTADMGKVLSFNISVTQALDNLEGAKTGTLLAAIRDNSTYVEPANLGIIENTTIPGQSASLETEKILTSTEDDYGISYYFRGNVTNNYVTYSNMCWRIVRVQGDGTIKIVLADEKAECNASTNSTSNTTTAFINNAQTYFYSRIFNTSGLIYEKSDILSELTTWMNMEVVNRNEETEKNLDTSKLATTEWCNDMSISSTKLNTAYDNGESGILDYYYGANGRIANTTTASPSLKCNEKGFNDSKAIRYESNIGMLTADEIAFAGGAALTQNLTYYLYPNTNGGSYWTISPNFYYGIGIDFPYIWYIDSNGSLRTSDVIVPKSIRPAVVLRSSVSVSTNLDIETNGNPGTINNPYIIE